MGSEPATTGLRSLYSADRRQFYEEFLRCADGLISGETSWLANLANLSALLRVALPRINWAGFYLLAGPKTGTGEGTELVLGPFQGKPACTRIPLGKGVCGKAAQDRRTYIVPDVHEFPGHIACDPESRSEIVIPIVAGDHLVGVLDIDSPVIDRFDEVDAGGLERFVEMITKKVSPGHYA